MARICWMSVYHVYVMWNALACWIIITWSSPYIFLFFLSFMFRVKQAKYVKCSGNMCICTHKLSYVKRLICESWSSLEACKNFKTYNLDRSIFMHIFMWFIYLFSLICTFMTYVDSIKTCLWVLHYFVLLCNVWIYGNTQVFVKKNPQKRRKLCLYVKVSCNGLFK